MCWEQTGEIVLSLTKCYVIYDLSFVLEILSSSLYLEQRDLLALYSCAVYDGASPLMALYVRSKILNWIL